MRSGAYRKISAITIGTYFYLLRKHGKINFYFKNNFIPPNPVAGSAAGPLIPFDVANAPTRPVLKT